MFSEMTINPFLTEGRIVGEINRSNVTQYELGKPEWQQPFISKYRELHTPKNIYGNYLYLDKPYIHIPNWDQIKFNNGKKQPFLSSYRRDFLPKKLKEKNILSQEKINFIKNSKIHMGNFPFVKESLSSVSYNDPKQQKLRFDYNKITFKYDKYNIHPITGEMIFKDPNRMFSFEYWNKDKDKHFIANRNMSFYNEDYRKVYDPITNRFMPGSVRAAENLKRIKYNLN